MLVRRFKTRKYYSYDFHRYISLDDITVYVQANCDLQILDEDGKDLTAETLSKIVTTIANKVEPNDLIEIIRKYK